MTVDRQPISPMLLFVLATSLMASITDGVPSGTSLADAPLTHPASSSSPSTLVLAAAEPNSSSGKGHGADSSQAPFSNTGADPALHPAAGPGNNSFADLKAVYLWTRPHASDTNYEVLDPNQPKTITNSSFLEDSKTYLLLHGFLDKGTAKWILKLKAKLLDLENCNVLAVEYDAGFTNSNASFFNVSARIPAVGAQTAVLLELLVKLRQQDLRQLHIIGHCLGAHVGGIAGLAVSGTVGRITGLDPAGLAFNNASRTKRLSSDDADFVDVIHTSGCNNINRWGDCMGLHIAVGHSDFWPNGGYFQPACRRSGKHHIDDECNHRVAQDYFLESFSYGTDRTLFLARPDDNYEHFCQSVQCGDFPQYMGINARKVNRKLEMYFLITSVQAPYAELDPSCPSLLSWHLIKGSTIAAIVLLAIGLLLVVLPAVALFFSCAKDHFVIQTVPYSPFEEHGAPPPTDFCPPVNQSYGGLRTGGIDEGSIMSRNNQTPLTSGGRTGQRNTRDYGGGGGEVLSDEDGQNCSASGIDSHRPACRLILRSESVDHPTEQSEDDGSLLCNEHPMPRDSNLEVDSNCLPAALQHLPRTV